MTPVSDLLMIFKNLSLNNPKGMKLKLDMHAYDISLYVVCVFIINIRLLSLLWHRLILRKEEIGNIFCLIGYIWTFFFMEMFIEYSSMFQVNFCQNH